MKLFWSDIHLDDSRSQNCIEMQHLPQDVQVWNFCGGRFHKEMVALAVVFKRLPSLGAVMPGQSSLSDVLLLPRGFPNDLGTP